MKDGGGYPDTLTQTIILPELSLLAGDVDKY